MNDDALILVGSEIDRTVQTLSNLRDDCHRAKALVYEQCKVNESLRYLPTLVEFDEIECVKTERWIDDQGRIGWRAYINSDNARLLGAMLSELRNMGWDDVELEWGEL